jgi:hypothetical protein
MMKDAMSILSYVETELADMLPGIVCILGGVGIGCVVALFDRRKEGYDGEARDEESGGRIPGDW